MKTLLFVLHLAFVYIACAYRNQGHSFFSRITKKRRSTFSARYSPIISDIGVTMYDAQLWFSHAVDTQFTAVTPLSLVILFVAGLITSFNPCSMGLIPLTLAYLGGSSDEGGIFDDAFCTYVITTMNIFSFSR
jgi:cytochrome c biogenesis protein CcdA